MNAFVVPTHSNILLELTRVVSSTLGLNYSGERLADLDRGLHSAAREMGMHDPSVLARQMISSLKQEHIDALARHLTVGETHFFRHPEAFDALEHHILPDLLRSRSLEGQRRLRIWSAACSTGEEPYSVAIALRKAIKDLDSWDITILATDVNTSSLDKASDACYSEWSFRGVSEEVRQTYFTATRDGHLRLIPDIRNMVTFSRLNLAQDTYPSPLSDTECMDLVLCRNVLIYFTQEQANRTMEGLCHSLVVGGWLLTSPVETMYGRETELASRCVGRATFLRREPPKLADGICARGDSLPTPADMPKSRTHSAKSAAKPAGRTSAFRAKPQTRPQRKTIVDHSSTYDEALALCEAACYEAASKRLLAAIEARRDGDGNGQHEILLARCYANMGNRADAITWCLRAIGINRVDSEYHYLYATIRAEQGDVDEAAEALRKAIFLDHDHVRAYHALGVLERRRGRETDARRHFHTALKLLGRHDESAVLHGGLSARYLAEAINQVLTEEKHGQTE